MYLKNRSIIKGFIIEVNPSTGIKIKTADDSFFLYEMDKILKTAKESDTKTTTVAKKDNSVISQYQLETFFKNYIRKNRPDLDLVEVTRVNGIKRLVSGQNI